jgi:hypothetical protein
MKKILLLAVLVLGGAIAHAQAQYEGLWEGYDGEWRHVSYQLICVN